MVVSFGRSERSGSRVSRGRTRGQAATRVTVRAENPAPPRSGRRHQRWRVADAVELFQLGLRAALRHLLGGLAQQQVRLSAAQHQRRAGDGVPQRPQDDVFELAAEGGSNAGIVGGAELTVVVATHGGRGEVAPLRIRQRAERRADLAQVTSRMRRGRRKAAICRHTGPDAPAPLSAPAARRR